MRGYVHSLFRDQAVDYQSFPSFQPILPFLSGPFHLSSTSWLELDVMDLQSCAQIPPCLSHPYSNSKTPFLILSYIVIYALT